MVIGNRSIEPPAVRELPAELWTAEEVAAFLRIPLATLYQWRYQGIGPEAFKVGRHLRYDPAVVSDWLTQRRGGLAS